MLGLCVKISHLRHKSHTQFLPSGAAIYVILRLSRAPRNKLNQAMWGRGTRDGGREGGRKSRRASGILNVAISKVQNRSFISSHMSYNMFRRAAPITTTEMKPRTIVFGKKYFILGVCSTHNNENLQMLLSRKHMCFIFGVLGSDIGLKTAHPD